MEITYSIFLFVIGLVALLFQNNQFVQRISASLGAIGVSCLLLSGFATDASVPLIHFSLIALVLSAFTVSLFRSKWFKYTGLVATLIALLPIGARVNYFDFEIAWTINIALLPFLGALIPFLSKLKAHYAEKWFAGNGVQFEIAVQLLYTGLMVFAATFSAGYFGVFLVGLGWLASGLVFKDNREFNGGLVFLSLAWGFYLVKSTELAPDALLRGNLFLGIFAGASMIPWMQSYTSKSKRVLLSVLLPMLVLVGLICLGIFNQNFGGIPVIVGALIGSSIVLLVTNSTVFSFVGLPFVLIGLSQPFVHLLTPEKLASKSMLSVEIDEKTVPKESFFSTAKAILLSDAQAGKWKSKLANSKLTFELGPDGNKTEGAFTDYDVTLAVDDKGNPSTISVTLKLASLTTFNDLRDESVLGSDYVNVAKYKTATYQSTAIKAEGDHFLVDGTLTFMGVSETVPLNIKFLASGKETGKDYLVFIGESAVDRSAHGMRSDAKIGDVVKVSFEIAVEKE
jgi:polyisoprenoid-binding protein YceI